MRRATAAALVGLLGAGCPTLSPFLCDDPADCDRGGREGICIDGDCAYDDPQCVGSELRFSPNAREMAGECVPDTNVDTGATQATTAASSSGAMDTGQPSCGVRRVIELDTGLLSAAISLPGYPALVVVEDPALGMEALPDGSDLWFSDANDSVLPHELDAFDAATGKVQAWVRLSGWELGVPLVIALHSGDLANAPAYAPTAVWADNFAGVWHFGDELADGRGEVVRDSTSAANHGFAIGGMNADQVTDGVIGRAFLFDGVDDSIDVDAAFVGALESFTISWWTRIDGDDTTHHPFFQSLNGTLYPRCRRLFAETGGNPFCQVGLVDETLTVGAEDTELPDGAIRHFALTYDADSSTARLFASGAEVATDTPAAVGPLMAGTEQFKLGRIDEFGSLLGMLDEVRVSLRALEPEWIAADVRNQGTPANLVVGVGAPEPTACP
jgi:hypothetical protein